MTHLAEKAYGASVRLGYACCHAMSDGASHEDVIQAVEHTLLVVKRNRDMGIAEASLAISAKGDCRA